MNFLDWIGSLDESSVVMIVIFTVCLVLFFAVLLPFVLMF